MANISPELLDKCKAVFAEKYQGSKQIQKLVNRVRDGTATLADARNYSTELGNMLGKTLNEVLTDKTLPDQTLFWNIAQDVITPMIDQNRNLVNVMAKDCQQIVYDNAKIGIGIKTPKKNTDRIKGLLDDVVASEDATTREYRIAADIGNITDSFLDDFIEENASAADNVGLTTKVIRSVGAGGCCEWCDSLAGIYDYDEVKDKGNEVWQRHPNCTCDIEVVTEKGSTRVNNYKTINPARKRK